MRLVGLSLSLCIQDIIEDKVRADYVDYIYTGTRAESPEDWDYVIEHYKQSYWRSDPERAEKIARKFLADGCLIQPRMNGEKPPSTNLGWWIVRF